MDFIKIINNAAFMGVIGVILGAIVSGIISSVNSKQIFRFQKEQHRIEKIEKVAIDFLILTQKLATFNLVRCSMDDRELKQKLNQEILDMNEQVKAEAQFYFDKTDYNLVLEICAMGEPTSENEVTQFNLIRTEKINQLLSNIQSKVEKG